MKQKRAPTSYYNTRMIVVLSPQQLLCQKCYGRPPNNILMYCCVVSPTPMLRPLKIKLKPSKNGDIGPQAKRRWCIVKPQPDCPRAQGRGHIVEAKQDNDQHWQAKRIETMNQSEARWWHRSLSEAMRTHRRRDWLSSSAAKRTHHRSEARRWQASSKWSETMNQPQAKQRGRIVEVKQDNDQRVPTKCVFVMVDGLGGRCGRWKWAVECVWAWDAIFGDLVSAVDI
jgi:hypothetical protein